MFSMTVIVIDTFLFLKLNLKLLFQEKNPWNKILKPFKKHSKQIDEFYI